MTSLAVPIACWNSYPKTTYITAKASFLNAKGVFMIAIAYASGHIWIYEATNNQIKPKLLLLGHSSEVTAMTMGQIELESLVDKSQVIVTASEDGQVSLWDLSDGHCIADSTILMEGGITKVVFSFSNKCLLCSGNSNRLVILDALSLDTLKSFDLCRNWISSMTMGFDAEGKESLLISSYDHGVYAYAFEESSLTFTTSPNFQQTMTTTTNLFPNFLVTISEYDRNIIMTLSQNYCEIHQYSQDSVSILCTLECPPNTHWTHAFFASERELIVLASNGHGYLYYLGPQSDIIFASIADLTTDCRGIITDGNWVIMTNCKKFGSEFYSTYKTATLLGVFLTSDGDHLCETSYFVLRESKSTCSIYGFGSQSGVDKVFKWTLAVGSFFGRLKLDHSSASFLSVNVDNLVQVAPCASWNLKDFWPLSRENIPRITSAITFEQSIVLGYDNGNVRLIPEALPLFCSPSEIQLANHGLLMDDHRSPIVYLYAEVAEISKRKLLISSCKDCSINVWNLENGELLQTFDNQSSPVFCVAPFPTQIGQRTNRRKVVCISKDHSVMIIDMEDLSCRNRFLNQSSPIANIYYNSSDELFAIESENRVANIWQLRSGVLERCEEGYRAQEILGCFEAKTKIDDYTPYSLNKNIKQTLNVYPVYSRTDEYPPVLVFMINIKRLINDISKGSHTLAQINSPNMDRARSKSVDPSSRRQPSNQPNPSASMSFGKNEGLIRKNTASPGKRLMNMAAVIRAKSSLPSIASTIRTKAHSMNSRSASQPGQDRNLYDAMGQNTSVSLSVPKVRSGTISNPLDVSLIQAIFASLMTWGLDDSLDQFCSQELGLMHPGAHVVYGMRGASGNLSFLIPQNTETKKMPWEISASMTASRLMNILSLIKSVLSMNGQDQSISRLYTHYMEKLPTLVGDAYIHPSFSVLARHWQDPIDDVQQACRSLVKSALESLPASRRQVIMAFWRKHLPTNPSVINKKLSRVNFRSAVIMSLLCCSKPDFFESKDTRDIAISLETCMKDDTKGTYRITAVEIMGFGFDIWEPHLNSANIIRYLLSLTGFVEQSKTDSAPALNITINTPPSSAELAVINMSKQSLVSISKINPALFIQTLSFDLSHVKGMNERAGWLKLLSYFVQKESLFLYHFLPVIIEAMVKSLDPNIPHMRETLLPSLSTTLGDLVRNYPNIAFNALTQRLVMGNMDGTCIVYDVRTATKSQILEGHKLSVTALAFNTDGKMLATYSLEENNLLIWQPSGGLFGALAGAFGMPGSGLGAHAHSGLTGMKIFRTFDVGQSVSGHPPLEEVQATVKLEWTSERVVKLTSINNAELTFQI